MQIFIYLTSNLYCLTPLFLIVCPLSISSSFVLFPIYSSKTGLCLLQYSQLRWGCDSHLTVSELVVIVLYEVNCVLLIYEVNCVLLRRKRKFENIALFPNF